MGGINALWPACALQKRWRCHDACPFSDNFGKQQIKLSAILRESRLDPISIEGGVGQNGSLDSENLEMNKVNVGKMLLLLLKLGPQYENPIEIKAF